MLASPAAYAIIQDSEGLRLDCYLCPSGVPTIGWGRTGRGVKMGMKPITREQADAWLKEDIAECERMLNEKLPLAVSQGQFDALVSFLFNLGPGRKKGTLGSKDEGRDGLFVLRTGQPSTLWRRVCAGDHAAAANEFGRWIYGAGGASLGGLVKRRAREAALYRSGSKS